MKFDEEFGANSADDRESTQRVSREYPESIQRVSKEYQACGWFITRFEMK